MFLVLSPNFFKLSYKISLLKINLRLYFSTNFHKIFKRLHLISYPSEDANLFYDSWIFLPKKGYNDQEPSCRRQNLPNFQQEPTTLKSN